MNIDVFISHHTDSSKSIVEAIANKLESLGIRCWYSGRDIEGGAYAGSIMQALSGCSIFLLVLNRPASESAHVLNELEIATSRLSKKENVIIVPFHIADEDIAPEARYYIQRHHWIDAVTPPMYQRIDELSEHLMRLLGRDLPDEIRSDASADHKLVSFLPQPREVFWGREDLLAQISSSFDSGKKFLFLEGIGGIGKSELAKQYAVQHRAEYDHVVFMTYGGSLKQLICNPTALVIEGLERDPEETDQAFFARKLGVLNCIANDRTLLILDNFDVNDDVDLKTFLGGNYRLIITTRNAHPGQTTIKIGSIEDMDVLMEIFAQNYGCGIEEEDKPTLMELFRLVECHTYTIELIAKQMEASFISAEEMLQMLKTGSFQSGISETVAGRNHQKTAFNHICALFNTGNLSEAEKQVLMYLSLAGTEGVPAKRFKQWAQLDSFEIINQLASKSWLRKDSMRCLSLHPMVREVVHHTLMPTVENCREYLWQMYLFCCYAWFRKYNENLEVADVIEAALIYFKDMQGKDYLIFQGFCNFLWQVARFDASIRHIHRVYDACVRDLGINTMETGFVAKAAGGCYFNSRRRQESIKWYRQGLESMLASGAEESEDLAMSYEKVARCCTWEYEQDFLKAKDYFEEALQIRQRLLERIKCGDKPRMIEVQISVDLALAYSRIGETYMETGRMYQAMGQYDKAYEYAVLYTRLVEEHHPDNVSGIAYGHYDSGVCCYQLALQLRQNGDEEGAVQQLSRAEEYLKRSLETNIKMRGALAVDTIDNQEYLADVYAAQHRYGEASNGYMAVLTMVENLLGKEHPRTVTVKQKMNFAG